MTKDAKVFKQQVLEAFELKLSELRTGMGNNVAAGNLVVAGVFKESGMHIAELKERIDKIDVEDKKQVPAVPKTEKGKK